MNTNETKARAAYNAALTDADQWRQTIAQLEHDLVAAEAEAPVGPADLAKIANRQVSLAKQLEMARAQLGAREILVLDAGKVIVAAEADDLQPQIDQARAKVTAIDLKSDKLRQALTDHLNHSASGRAEADTQAKNLSRTQAGLRAAVSGEGVREYFPDVESLPLSLHPATGILPQTSYQADIDRAAEEEAYRQLRADGQKAMDEVAAGLKVKDGLTTWYTEWEQPDPEWLRSVRISAEAFAVEFNDPGHLGLFDRAAEHADARSMAIVVAKLNKIWDARRGAAEAMEVDPG